jgi:hypothetical protein
MNGTEWMIVIFVAVVFVAWMAVMLGGKEEETK